MFSSSFLSLFSLCSVWSNMFLSSEQKNSAKHGKADSDSSGTSPKSASDYMRKLRRTIGGKHNPQLKSVDDVIAHFDDCFDAASLAPQNRGFRPAGGVVKIDIPLDQNGKPDMLRLKLPAEFPSEKRADDVLKLLVQGDQHVVAAGVSGAGKS